MDTMNAKMHMKNNIQHKTRKHQDQTRRLVKNNLKIMKNTMNAWIFEKCKKIFLKHAIDTKLKNWLKTQTRNTKYFWFLWFYDFFVFLLIFFKNIFGKTKKKRKILKKIFENFWKENYLIWATRWTVSCPYSNNPRQRCQKLGGRNCDHQQWLQRFGALKHESHFVIISHN